MRERNAFNLIWHEPWKEPTAHVGRGRIFARSTLPLLLAFVVAIAMLASPVKSVAAAPPPSVAVGVAVSFGPPPLPYYAQPFCPGPGYIWTPGYWAWDPYYGYYWVPGTWVFAPFPGALWTPGYWGWDYDGDDFLWYPGYWGPVVGFYGGVVYGYGYTGYGYQGGYWQGGSFYYNRAVNNVSTTNITNVYNRTVINNVTANNISYNGGNGGTTARPTRAQMAAANRRRSGPVAAQTRQMQMAQADPGQRASVNHGAPAVAATPRPGVFRGRGVVLHSRASARYNEPRMNRASAPPARAEHANPRRGGWHPFSKAPERAAPPVRAARPARGRPQRESPAFRPNRSQPQRNAIRPPMVRHPAPPQRIPHAAPDRRIQPQRMPHALPERRIQPPHPQAIPHGGKQRNPHVP